jgi:serine/threonine protein kinase
MLMTRQDHSFGDNVGRYQLIGEIARGGMGIVYIAAAQGPAGFSKLVALKELKPDLVQDSDFLTMFLEEARLAARLSHPNIVQTNDVNEFEGRHFIAMEYLDGRSFYRVLRRFAALGGYPQRMALSALRDVLSALDYAHELRDFNGSPMGFVHRDISPHNIFITFDGHTKVIDFGIAKARDSSLETKTGVLKGRASYMAPEQLTRRADRRTDIFSVGAILFEIITGRRLWQGLNEIEILGHLTTGDIPSVSTARPDTPPVLVQICQTALSARPEDRYSSAAEMRDAIDEYLWSTGGAPKIGDISTKLSEVFNEERHKTREAIDTAISRLQSGEGGQLETFAVPEPREHGTGSLQSRVSRVSRVAQRPSGNHSASQLVVTDSPMYAMPNDPMFATLMPAPARPAKPQLPDLLVRHGKLVAAAALSVVFLATTLTIALHHSPPPVDPPVVVERTVPAQPPAPRPAAAPAPLQQAPAPVSDTIVFSVSVAPSTAQVLIDGDPMPSNPFLGRFPKSATTHRIRAVAQGFMPKERLVNFTDNVMIDLNLTPRPPGREPVVRRRESFPPRRVEFSAPQQPAAAPAPAPSPPPARSSAPADIAPRGEWEAPRRRGIDSNNPYGEEK